MSPRHQLFLSRLALVCVPGLAAGLFATSTAHGAETIVAERLSALQRLVDLQKITVGPDDQYHGTVDPTGNRLVFTRKSDLVSHVCTQDLKTGEVKDWLPLTADSQEPVINTSGEVAFTYYKFNARGDICHRALAETNESKIVCLKGDENERSTPFWKSDTELGFLVRDLRTQRTQIMVTRLDTGSTSVLAEGAIWSPSMQPGGKYLVYNQMTEAGQVGEDSQRALVLQNLATGAKKILRFSLPGISGFPAISQNEDYLYFSHYLNDSNNDNVIDGNDNSVVFRAPIEALLSGNDYFPEQLTSAAHNCSFPQPYGDQVYVTCAFEGNLDMYRMPLRGIVPSAWDRSRIQNAHQTSRAYQDRILLLNTLKYRFKDQDVPALTLRLLSDHLLADDITASQFYLRALQQGSSEADRAFYGLLSLYLEGRAKKKAQPSDEVSRAFQKEVLALDLKVKMAPGSARFKTIIRGLFRTFLNQPAESLAFLKQIRFDGTTRPLERVYGFYLADWTLKRTAGAGALTAVYREMMSAPELSEESRVFYGFQFLRYLESTLRGPSERLAAIAQADYDLPPSVSALLKSEAATLGVIEASDDAGKAAAYHTLDLLMNASRDQYFLRKALYVRSILNFAAAAEFKYLGFVATNWLRYTHSDDTEFGYARQVYARATLDRAYDTFASKQYDLAGNYFYGSLSLTDDLESHWGYLATMALKKQRATIDERYKNLKERKFIDDNLKFVGATLALIDAGPETGARTGYLDQAINQLKGMEQDRDSSIRYLFLGYCYLQKLLKTAEGYDFDHGLFEEAHRNLMLAFDQGRDNERVKASALLDLGILHQRVQNPGLAAKFLALRKGMGFIDLPEEARFAWIYSRALFYVGQSEQAVKELDQVLSHAVAGGSQFTPDEWSALKERKAFYLVTSGKYEEALDAYRELAGKGSIRGDLNSAKTHLAQGYAFTKLNRAVEAHQALQSAIEEAKRLQPMKHDRERWVDFQPVRIQLDAYGLLGQSGAPAEKLQALERRKELLDREHGLYEDQIALSIQVHSQIAALLKTDSPAKAQAEARAALVLAQRLGDSGQHLSIAVYRAVVDFLVLGIRHPEYSAHEDASRVEGLVSECLKAYDAQKPAPPALLDQKFKLHALWSAYSTRVLKAGQWNASALRAELDARPEHSPELDRLWAGLGKTLR